MLIKLRSSKIVLFKWKSIESHWALWTPRLWNVFELIPALFEKLGEEREKKGKYMHV